MTVFPFQCMERPVWRPVSATVSLTRSLIFPSMRKGSQLLTLAYNSMQHHSWYWNVINAICCSIVGSSSGRVPHFRMRMHVLARLAFPFKSGNAYQARKKLFFCCPCRHYISKGFDTFRLGYRHQMCRYVAPDFAWPALLLIICI